MPEISPIIVAKGAGPLALLPRYCNRHGLIAGATGATSTGSDTWQRPAGTRRETPRRESRADEASRSAPRATQKEEKGMIEQVLFGTGRRQGVIEAAAKSVARNVAGQVGREILRGILGSILKR